MTDFAINEAYSKSHPQRYDLFKHLCAMESFIIDFDSLVLRALQDAQPETPNVPTSQFVECVFSVETFLLNLSVRGATFSIVRFACNDRLWAACAPPRHALFRECLWKHLARSSATTKVTLRVFADWWTRSGTDSYAQFLARYQPEFIILSDGEDLPSLDWSTQVRAQGLYSLVVQAVIVVFSARVIFKDSSAVAFVWRDASLDKSTVQKYIEEIQGRVIPTAPATAPQALPNPGHTYRTRVAAAALRDITSSNADLGCAFALHIALLETVPLDARCFELATNETSTSADVFFADVCNASLVYVRRERQEREGKDEAVDPNADNTTADLYDYRVFMKVVQAGATGVPTEVVEVATNLYSTLAGKGPFVIPTGSGSVTMPTAAGEDDDETNEVDLSYSPLATWLSLPKNIEMMDNTYHAYEDYGGFKRERFFHRVHKDAETLGETRYSLTREGPRVDTHRVSAGETVSQIAAAFNQKFTKEGFSTSPEQIRMLNTAVSLPESNDAAIPAEIVTLKIPLSADTDIKASAANIMLKNTSKRITDDLKTRSLRLDTVKSEFGNKTFQQGQQVVMKFVHETIAEGKKLQSEILRIPTCEQSTQLLTECGWNYLCLVMEAYHFLLIGTKELQGAFSQWENEVNTATTSGRQPKKTIAGIPFLVIHRMREVLEGGAQHIKTEAAKKKSRGWLRDMRDLLATLGLSDNVRVWEETWRGKGILSDIKMPTLYVPDKNPYNVELSAIRFQMTVLGDRLERPRSAPDFMNRVPFTPDEWQKELLDIVDARQSALVCTPTSAGKTFVSFYCIKENLIEKNDPLGLIVYVCPTKALLRQSLASIYAKYEKKYDSSWNVYGVLEDYAFMLTCCQALVTIPEAFETLLLSPRLDHQLLMQRITYVIFDEIHSIDDLRTGCVWERLLTMIRCPFIALSATVGNPGTLGDWLQTVANTAKGQQERRERGMLDELFEEASLKSPPDQRLEANLAEILKILQKRGLTLTHPTDTLAKRVSSLQIERASAKRTIPPLSKQQFIDTIVNMPEGRFTVNILPRRGKKIHRWSDLQKYVFRPAYHYQPKLGKTKAYDDNGMLDKSYQEDGFIDVHPMSVLTLRKLLDDGQFPQDLPFLPHEMLQLFDAMKSHVSRKKTPQAYNNVNTTLDPTAYFNANSGILVTQNSARQYESALISEFMSWVRFVENGDSKEVKKAYRELVQNVLSDVGSGVGFIIPRTGRKLYKVMEEAYNAAYADEEEEEDNPLLTIALDPVNFFRFPRDANPDDIRRHQYLLVCMLLHWERCDKIDQSGKHADMCRYVLKEFGVSMFSELPSPLNEYYTLLITSNPYDPNPYELPHLPKKGAVKRGSSPVANPKEWPVPGCDSVPENLLALFNVLNTAESLKEGNFTLDALLPANFFAFVPTKDFDPAKPAERQVLLNRFKNLVKRYRTLLLCEYLRNPPSGYNLPQELANELEVIRRTCLLMHSLEEDEVAPRDERFLRLPLLKSSAMTPGFSSEHGLVLTSQLDVQEGSHSQFKSAWNVPLPTSTDYTKEFMHELCVTLNTRDMLPAIVFNFDITTVERLAFDLADKLEKIEAVYRSSREFQAELEKVEGLKQQAAALEKAKKGRSKAKGGGGGGEDGEEEKGARDSKSRNVQKDEFEDLSALIKEIPPILPQFSFARQGVGEDSSKVQKLIDEYLPPGKRSELDNRYIKCILRGIGIHHTGTNSKVQALMEHLFRTLNLGVMFSTTTLALGVHSPCRSVVIAGDDVELTNVQFRQMAGRAGRRGLDTLGHVILFGLPQKKVERLLTSKLQTLRGHTIINATTSLQTTHQEDVIDRLVKVQQKDSKRNKTFSDAFLATAAALVREDRERIHVSSFLSACYSKAGLQVDTAQRELWDKYTKAFLQSEGFLQSEVSDAGAIPVTQTNLLVRALHCYNSTRMNPLNFSFLALLRSGVLHELSRKDIDSNGEFREKIRFNENAEELSFDTQFITVLATFFQTDEFGLPLECHRSLQQTEQARRYDHAVRMPALPANVQKALEAYCRRVLRRYASFVAEVTQIIPQSNAIPTRNELPFSRVAIGGSSRTSTLPGTPATPPRARSPFSAAGTGKADVFTSVTDLCESISPVLQVDSSLIPCVDFKGMVLNACSYDYLRNGTQRIHGNFERQFLQDFNALTYDNSWNVLSRFHSCVSTLLSMSHSMAPRMAKMTVTVVDEISKYGVPIHDAKGKVFSCSNLNCPWVTAEDRQNFPGYRLIRGMVFICNIDGLYLCQGCAFDTPKPFAQPPVPGTKCPEQIKAEAQAAKGEKVEAHEFVPYVDDDFVSGLEWVSHALQTRDALKQVPGLGGGDPWERHYVRDPWGNTKKWNTIAVKEREDKVRKAKEKEQREKA